MGFSVGTELNSSKYKVEHGRKTVTAKTCNFKNSKTDGIFSNDNLAGHPRSISLTADLLRIRKLAISKTEGNIEVASAETLTNPLSRSRGK